MAGCAYLAALAVECPEADELTARFLCLRRAHPDGSVSTLLGYNVRKLYGLPELCRPDMRARLIELTAFAAERSIRAPGRASVAEVRARAAAACEEYGWGAWDPSPTRSGLDPRRRRGGRRRRLPRRGGRCQREAGDRRRSPLAAALVRFRVTSVADCSIECHVHLRGLVLSVPVRILEARHVTRADDRPPETLMIRGRVRRLRRASLGLRPPPRRGARALWLRGGRERGALRRPRSDDRVARGPRALRPLVRGRAQPPPEAGGRGQFAGRRSTSSRRSGTWTGGTPPRRSSAAPSRPSPT